MQVLIKAEAGQHAICSKVLPWKHDLKPIDSSCWYNTEGQINRFDYTRDPNPRQPTPFCSEYSVETLYTLF
jgi:hypothetical protein